MTVPGGAPCCADEATRVTHEVQRRKIEGGVVVETRCVTCGLRHFVLEAEPIPLGHRGASVA